MRTVRALFVVVCMLMIGATVGFCLGTTVPLFQRYANELKPAIHAGFIVNFVSIALETVCAAIGMLLFLKNGKKNIFLLVSLIIAMCDFRVYANRFVALFIDFGLVLPWGAVGIGVNLVGAALLAWYLLLRREA